MNPRIPAPNHVGAIGRASNKNIAAVFKKRWANNAIRSTINNNLLLPASQSRPKPHANSVKQSPKLSSSWGCYPSPGGPFLYQFTPKDGKHSVGDTHSFGRFSHGSY